METSLQRSSESMHTFMTCIYILVYSGIDIFCGSKNQAQPRGNQGDKVASQSMFVYETMAESNYSSMGSMELPLWAGASTDDRWSKWNPSP